MLRIRSDAGILARRTELRGSTSGSRGGFAIIGDPKRRGPNLSIDQAPVQRVGKRSWIHLDLMTLCQTDEVERLIGLGARRYDWRYPPNADYVVLEDPDGNLFCVCQVSQERAAIEGCEG